MTAPVRLGPKPVRSNGVNPMMRFAFVFAGIIVGALIMYFAVLPSATARLNSDIAARDAHIEKLEMSLSGLRADKDSMDEDMAKLNKELSYTNEVLSKSKSALLESERLIKAMENRYLAPIDNKKAGGILISINAELLPEGSKLVFDKVSADTLPKLAATSYRDGYNSYRRGRYDDAISYLDMAYSYAVSGDAVAYKSLYFKGRSYLKKGDTAKADESFKKIVDEYPSCDLADDAAYLMKHR